ncbi:MAG: translocation protein TolB [Bryobacteraceae bacterium]|jgi:TolB protein
MKRAFWFTAGFAGLLLALAAQQPDIRERISGGTATKIAVPDLRGSGAAQPLMNGFNETLYNDLDASGLFKIVPKTMYPLQTPQQPSDFREPPAAQATRPGQQPPNGGGAWLSDWASPPVSANYLVFGYTAVQNNVLVLYGWLFNVGQTSVSQAQVLGKRYFGSPDEPGAKKTAHEFAADIIAQMGGTSLLGTKIYFVSNRTGQKQKEIWVMDPDGSNQRQITHLNSLSIMPAVSPDGAKIAFTSFARGNPAIFILATDTGRRLPFYNQVASMNATPDFTPDGKQLLYASTASGRAQIYAANIDGSNLRRISNTFALEVEPKVNPKTGTDLVFVSGRSGPQQIYRMNMEGTDVQRLSNGEGEASNPCWHPNGQMIAFAWTRGFATGNFNIFLMDVASRNFNQLTYGAGRNENPSWAPDGRHIAFMSTRSGTEQIWTMLADGTQLKQLTTAGRNSTPVWAK